MNVQLNRDERRLVVVNAIIGLFIFVKLTPIEEGDEGVLVLDKKSEIKK